MRERRASGARCEERRSQGVAMVVIITALVALLAFGALALDVGLVWTARTQLQSAVDAAALAAAASMIDPDVPAVTIPDARTEAESYAGQNPAVANPSVSIDPNADVTFGNFDLETRVFDTGVDLTDPFQVTAARVVASMNGSPNAPAPAFLARIVGRDSFDVTAEATAYLGCAGSLAEELIDLPIAIDCCKLRGADCDQDYCDTIANPPGACDLKDPQVPDTGQVSCIKFHPTQPQNGCWTAFDGDNPSVNTPDLTDIVNAGNPVPVSKDDQIYVDNGTKTPVVQDIFDKFHGFNAWSGDPAGTDRYAPTNPPDTPSDSWLVRLPVISCQTLANCATGTPAVVKGFVCFEVREVHVTPEKEIRGRFLCPTNVPPELEEEFDEKCQPDSGVGAGGDCFSMFATDPVLVE